jgi:hypothetical protein
VLLALSAVLPVLGIVETTKETFSGSWTPTELVLRSDSGPICRGEIHMVGLGYGSGTLRCSDGRSGRFSVSMAGGRGSAYGTLDGKSLTLSIG